MRRPEAMVARHRKGEGSYREGCERVIRALGNVRRRRSGEESFLDLSGPSTSRPGYEPYSTEREPTGSDRSGPEQLTCGPGSPPDAPATDTYTACSIPLWLYNTIQCRFDGLLLLRQEFAQGYLLYNSNNESTISQPNPSQPEWIPGCLCTSIDSRNFPNVR